MKSHPNYYLIGLFLSIGLALLLGALIFLGAGILWKETATIETYMDDSVHGLSTGSQVKMRGVRVGHVRDISFVHHKYPEAREIGDRYVLLELSLELREFGDISKAEFESYLENEVQRGLRIRLMPEGLTGIAYIEMDYLDPVRHPPLQINWDPEHPHVPSAPGTMARLEETFHSLANTMENLEEIDLQQTFKNLNQMMQSVDKTVQSMDMAPAISQAETLIQELRESNRKISRLIGPEQEPKSREKRADLQSVLTESKNILKRLDNSLKRLELDRENGTADKLVQTINHLHRASEQMPATMENINVTTQSLKQGSEGVEQLTQRTYSMLRAQNEELRIILDNMRTISENLLDLSQDAKKYPSYLLFGEEPLESEPK